MTIFWSLAALLLVLALLFTLPPLLRHRKTDAASADELNIEVVRAQLDELKADLEAGRLDRAQYASAREDLEKELLYGLSNGDEQDAPPVRSGRWVAIVIVLVVPMLAVLLYNQLGSAKLIGVLQQQAASSKATQEAQARREHTMSELVDRLALKLQSDPDNLEGWALLARSYMSLKRYDDALDAYANMRRIGGDNSALLADYADAMVTAGGGRFSDEAGRLLARAIELDPGNLKALWLMGHREYDRGDYAGAIRYWEQVAGALPPDDGNTAIIRQQIAAARSRLDGERMAGSTPAAPAAAAEAPTPSATGPAITVAVQLDPALRDKVAADDTLFIFARAAKGPRMPLAVSRKQVKDLPVTVTLDDAMAMSPAMKLSAFDQVTIGALVSRAGVAMPKSGDLQGTVTPVSTREPGTVKLVIDSVVP